VTNKKSPATRLTDYITALLPWAHGHQLKAIVDFVAAIIEKQTANQAKLARRFGNQEAAVKRLSRLLHNQRLSPKQLADAVLQQALAQLPRTGKLRLAIDWTIEGAHHLPVVSLVTGGRALPIYWRAYSATILKGRMRRYDCAVIKRVLTQLKKQVGNRRLRVAADRGFADVDLAQLFEDLRVAYIIRVKSSTKICLTGEWRNLKKLGFEGNARQRNFGRVAYCESSPHRLFVSMSRARNQQGRWEIWYLVSNRSYSAKQAANEYRRRFGCEQGFRDVKWELGFSQARIEAVPAWSRMFALFAIALMIVVTLGMKLLVRGAKTAFQLLRRVASRRQQGWNLSLVSAMVSLLKLHENLFEHLSAHIKFNLEAAL
jgi:Transposase DDE domain